MNQCEFAEEEFVKRTLVVCKGVSISVYTSACRASIDATTQTGTLTTG